MGGCGGGRLCRGRVAIGGEVGVVVPMGMVAVGMAGVVFVVVFVVVGVVVGVVRDVGGGMQGAIPPPRSGGGNRTCRYSRDHSGRLYNDIHNITRGLKHSGQTATA